MKVLRPSSHRKDATCRVFTLVTLRRGYSEQGFTLAVALGMGLVMILVAATLLVTSQQDQVIAVARNQTGKSLAVAEGGIARTLTQLTKPHNAVLLTLNYDSLNPHTGKTYLGPDGILNNGDEESTAVNQWTSLSVPSGSWPCTPAASSGSPDVSYSGTIGATGHYTLRAYRYNSTLKTGTFLVEGKQESSASSVKVTVSIDSVVSDFPGVLALQKMALSGRSVLGSNGNVYYDPDSSANFILREFSVRGDPSRSGYLNAIWSGSNDGFSVDNVDGKIVACKLSPTLSYTAQGPSLYDITDSNLPTPPISGSSGGITHYQASKIDIENKTIDVNTTDGPVYLYVNGPMQVKGTAKIRNIRTDGELPRVGDLRIIIAKDGEQIQIYDKACIQNAFIYSRNGNLQHGGSDDGCPSSGNTNIDGVVWVREMTSTTGGPNNPGIAVPDDLSSLSDIVDSIGLPTINKFGFVQSWQLQKL